MTATAMVENVMLPATAGSNTGNSSSRSSGGGDGDGNGRIKGVHCVNTVTPPSAGSTGDGLAKRGENISRSGRDKAGSSGVGGPSSVAAAVADPITPVGAVSAIMAGEAATMVSDEAE
ncbi:hypothetical protein Vretifemale_16413, partial [Volvox reticuliferus]